MSNYATDAARLPSIDWLSYNKPCGMAGFEPDFVPFDKVELLASNMSTAFSVTTLAKADDLSALVPRIVNTTAKFQMTTFGARATCQPDETFYVNDEKLVTVRRGKGSQDLRWPKRMSSRPCVGDSRSCPSSTVDDLRTESWRFLRYGMPNAQPGPFELALKFWWPLYVSSD